jgi:hypothetical protein
VSDYLKLLHMDSLAASQTFADGSVDFLLLDGDHELAGLRADLKAWWPKMKAGKKMYGHDFDKTTNPDVCLAVLEFAATNSLKMDIQGRVWSLSA